jgi:hypothetical protein
MNDRVCTTVLPLSVTTVCCTVKDVPLRNTTNFFASIRIYGEYLALEQDDWDKNASYH